MSEPTRPILRWHGGKWKLAPWIVSFFPSHRVYVEPFGGAASVLIRKPRAFAEIYNDLDGELVNLFTVLRSPASVDLVHHLRMTPFSRREFDACYVRTDEPIERARRLIVRSFMGHGSGAPFFRPTGFRNASGAHNTAAEWAGYPDALELVIDRLKGVVIEACDAIDVMAKSDRTDTLHYVDPPYLPATRSPRAKRGGAMYHAYAHELTDADHARLLESLRGLSGYVVLSGYPAAIYDDMLAGWRREQITAMADGARERIEVLWINPACADALDRARSQAELFV